MSATKSSPIVWAASEIDRLPSADDVGIRADDVVLCDDATPGTLERERLLEVFESDAAKLVEEIIETHMVVARAQGEQIVKQMFEDAWNMTGEQIPDRHHQRACDEVFSLIPDLMDP
jgi:hypothetical protein